MSIYEQIGGDSAIALAVDSFYCRVIDDPTLAPYFAGMNLTAIKAHQRDYFSLLLDGPEVYDGRSMRNAHTSLAISDADFTCTLGHLRDTLEELAVDATTIDLVLHRIEGMRAAIVAVR